MSRGSVRAFARREWGPLYGTVREALVVRRWRAIPLTLTAVLLTSVLQIVQNQDWGYQPVQDLGSVRAADPLGLALLRTPLSLFVPALDLPVWGALAQVLVVFGIAEICLGRGRTLFLAYAATLAGTLYARVALALGPDNPLGLPAADAQVVDTGPSAAVVALAVYVCWRRRARWTAILVVVAMVVEVLVKNNLAGKEHIAALVAVGVVVAVQEWRDRRRRPRTGDGSPVSGSASGPVDPGAGPGSGPEGGSGSGGSGPRLGSVSASVSAPRPAVRSPLLQSDVEPRPGVRS
ncbi:hypothetical protein AB0C52_34155 [Streptomyces sp. NPDC048717]|uniref:hypothetical protein n=1 Tax=Streptomyces sp. NPDC048717 TaxID=3154928 RepID=UPI00343E8EC4